MAVLAAPDWQLHRDHTMDLTAVNSQSSSIPRQRSSPANDHAPSTNSPLQLQSQQQQQQQQQQQPYPYPVQQQQPQGGWTPSIAAQPFYPSFYQNPHQQSYQLHGLHGHAPQPQMNQGAPYFDPNAQLAQWAYQQMMFNAQQQAHQLIPSHIQGQRSNPSSPAEYFPQNQIPPAFGTFPSGTQPANQFPGGRGGAPGEQSQYNGFHPYRRPNRQPSRPPDENWRGPAQPGPPQPPYARTDASASSSSVNSASSQGGSPRTRTNSNQSSTSAKGHAPPNLNNSSVPASSVRSRTGPPQQTPAVQSNGRTGSSAPLSTPSTAPSRPHHRSQSSTSSSSSSVSVRASASSATTVSSVARPARPSPLSQGNFTAAEKRMSRDDTDLAAMQREATPSAAMIRSGGLKGRLRRALSFNAAQALQEDEDDDDVSIKASSSKPPIKPSPRIGPVSPDETDDGESTATVQTKKKSRAQSLFNSRMNLSTDNISLSSTVSSASVMIRKLGSMGKLARRNSLAGITSLFKDKKDKDNEDDAGGSGSGSKKDKKKNKGGKAEASQASVSHVTAELDRTTTGDWSVGNEMSGLSPAAKLARQHTLKSNAEAAARKADLEAQATERNSRQVNGTTLPTTWEKNTTTRQGSVSPVKGGAGVRVTEDGTRVLVEDDDDSASDDGTADGHYAARERPEWDEDNDDDWDEGDEDRDGDGDEDVTIRVGLEQTSLVDDGDDVVGRWAMNVRRSVERARLPAKGILKHAGSYDQHSHMAESATSTFSRARSNSYNSHPGKANELGPLARIPSPDPDHIDGLSRRVSHSSIHSPSQNNVSAPTPSLPPLSFDSTIILESPIGSPRDLSEHNSLAPHPPERTSAIFNHPNSSAPALSVFSGSTQPPMHRSATVPAKKTLAFANNLSVYDTFSSSVYDRRSEPATWSRLTPALAQRIKEELNSYKMEEMEVHAASRIHTQFFV